MRQLNSLLLIFLVSCALVKKSEHTNLYEKSIYIKGETTAGQFKLGIPCNIKILENDVIIADTNSNVHGEYEITFNLTKNKFPVIAIVTPLKESVVKDTIIGKYQTITIECKNKLTNNFYIDTFNIDIAFGGHNFNLDSCPYFYCCDKSVSH